MLRLNKYSLNIYRSLSRGEIMAMLRRWFVESKNLVNVSMIVCWMDE